MKPLDAHPPVPAIAVGAPEGKRTERHNPNEKPLAWRIPVLGAILRELTEGDPDFPLYAGISIGSLFIIALLVWGLPALVAAALLATPLVGAMLLLLTRG